MNPTSNIGTKRTADGIDNRVDLKGKRRSRDGSQKHQAGWQGRRSVKESRGPCFSCCFYPLNVYLVDSASFSHITLVISLVSSSTASLEWLDSKLFWGLVMLNGQCCLDPRRET